MMFRFSNVSSFLRNKGINSTLSQSYSRLNNVQNLIIPQSKGFCSTKLSFKSLNEFNSLEVSQLFQKWNIPISNADIQKAGLDGEMLTVLESKAELQEIGLSISSLKFKVLMNRIKHFNTSDEINKIPAVGVSELTDNKQANSSKLESTTALKSQVSEEAVKTPVQVKTVDPVSQTSKPTETTVSSPAAVVKPTGFPSQVFPIRVIDIESAQYALQTIHTDTLMAESLYSIESKTETIEKIVKLIHKSAENQRSAGENGICDQTVDNLLALLESRPSDIQKNVPLIVGMLNLISTLCRRTDKPDTACTENITALDKINCIEAVVKVLSLPAIHIQAPLVAEAACRVVQRMASIESESYENTHVTKAVMTVLRLSKDFNTQKTALGAITNLCVVNPASNITLMEENFGSVLTKLITTHAAKKPMILECLWALRNHTAIDDTDLQKQVRDSGIFRLFPTMLASTLTNKEHADLAEILCNIIANVTANDVANRYVMGSLGVPEYLARMYVAHVTGLINTGHKTPETHELSVAIQEAIWGVCMENEDNRKAAEAILTREQ